MKIFGFIHLKHDSQTPDQQKFELLQYAHKERFLIDEFIELESLYIQNLKPLNINPGDALLISNLNEISPFLNEIITILVSLSKQKIQLISLAQPNIYTLHEHIPLFQMYTELLQLGNSKNLEATHPTKSKQKHFKHIHIIDLDTYISIPVQIIIHRKNNQSYVNRVPGFNISSKRIGRPVGTGGKSKLDQYKDEILELLRNGSTQRFIAKRYNVSYQNLNIWLKRHQENK